MESKREEQGAKKPEDLEAKRTWSQMSRSFEKSRQGKGSKAQRLRVGEACQPG